MLAYDILLDKWKSARRTLYSGLLDSSRFGAAPEVIYSCMVWAPLSVASNNRFIIKELSE